MLFVVLGIAAFGAYVAYQRHAIKVHNAELASLTLEQKLDRHHATALDHIPKKIINLYSEPVRRHIPVLTRKFDQLAYEDDYGNLRLEEWDREVKSFIKNTFHMGFDRETDSMDDLYIEGIINYEMDEYRRKNPAVENSFQDVESPVEYERFVADTLRDQGWTAKTTKASGDQGVDVIATKNDIKVVIQCKLYSSPVGNKAVQEVFASQKHEQADLAIVVTNSSFTKSARQLAGTTGVILMHHDQLSELDDALQDDGDD